MEQAVSRADDALKVQEGYGFEKMVRLLTEECSRKAAGDFALTEIVRGYWNKADGSDIEIDLVAINEEDAIVRFGSCKRSANNHSTGDLSKFEAHMDRFLGTKEGRRLSNFTIERALYSPLFLTPQRRGLENQGYICRDLRDFARYLDRKIPAMADAKGRGPLA